MSIVPEFLIKRVYKKGSLRQTDEGIEFDLKNVLGPGVISGFEYVQINDHKFAKEATYFITQGVKNLAECITELTPVNFRLGQEGTLHLEEKVQCLKEGINKIIIELTNPEAGHVKITFEDVLKPT